MKNAVMISIRPKWCELIANGEKTIEIRKTRPRLATPVKCYIYETKGQSEAPTFIDEEGHIIYDCGGIVIGEKRKETNMLKQRIGVIYKIDLERNPSIKERFRYSEESYTRRIGPRSDTVRSKLFYCSLDYEDVESNTRILKENPQLILISEPFFVDDELRERVTKWVEWANQADPKNHDPFYNFNDKQGANQQC